MAHMAARVRLTPQARREQLLELGAELFATRTLDELSIDLLADEAGISRGLLYHYFDSKQEFHRAVIGRAVDDLVAATAPVDEGEPLDRLVGSLTAYVGYIEANFTGYLSLVQAALGGDPVIRALYEDARRRLLDRMFTTAVGTNAMAEFGFVDTPATRLVLQGWASLAETMVIEWVRKPGTMSRDQLINVIVGGLPGMLEATRSQD
jgi:AcrR family transcriptional regulator